MTPEDEALADTIADIVDAAVGPLQAEIKALQAAASASEARWQDVGTLRERLAVVEAQKALPGPPGADGRPGPEGAPGRDGRDGLNGKDGADGRQGIDGIAGRDGKDGADGLHGKDGASGRDGVNGKDGAPGLNGKDGSDGLHGKDGAPGRDGINGKDGADGLHGKDGAPGLNGKDGVDGLHGKDGAPGLSLEDIQFGYNKEARQITSKFVRGQAVIQELAFTLEGLPKYQGVYVAGKTYHDGDLTTWDGSVWMANATTTDRPGQGPTAWTMIVKHGEKGSRGADGKPGRDGKDINVPHVHFTGPMK